MGVIIILAGVAIVVEANMLHNSAIFAAGVVVVLAGCVVMAIRAK